MRQLFLLILSITIFFNCNPDEERETYEGIYSLSFSDNPEKRKYEMQLVTAEDSATYGIIQSGDFSVPIRLKKATADSLFLSFWFGDMYVNVSRGETMAGKAMIRDTLWKVNVTKVTDTVNIPGLSATKELVPLLLKAEAPAFSSHKKDGRFYVIGWAGKSIYLVDENEDNFKQTELTYNKDSIQFSSLGLSPDEKTLIAHGNIMPRSDETEGGSLYLLHLNTETEIGRIEKLPETVNTPSYDNFPDFTAEGDIIFSSWGTPEGTINEGEGDLYIARKIGNRYQTAAFSETINTENADAGPFIDRQGQFVLFHRSTPEDPTDKLYIAKKEDGEWQEAVKLKATDFQKSYQYGPRIDHQNEYLYFTSHHRVEGNLYRIPIDQVDEFKDFTR